MTNLQLAQAFVPVFSRQCTLWEANSSNHDWVEDRECFLRCQTRQGSHLNDIRDNILDLDTDMGVSGAFESTDNTDTAGTPRNYDPKAHCSRKQVYNMYSPGNTCKPGPAASPIGRRRSPRNSARERRSTGNAKPRILRINTNCEACA